MTLNLVHRSRGTPSYPSLLEEFLSEPFLMVAPMTQQAQSLAVDVSEAESDVVVRASVPGFRKDQIAIEVHDDVLTIRAEKSEEVEEKNERYTRRERRAGSFARSLALPAPVATEKAQAELKDGVLTLTIPKNQKAQPRKISIN